MLILQLLIMLYLVSAGCNNKGKGGCSPPQGKKWLRWDMAGSTYMYCYGPCPIDWLVNNTHLKIGEYGGVVGYDHYFTHQGMPCKNGQPREFAMQDEQTVYTKTPFPTARVLQYRILSAVPYDPIVHNKILGNPEYFIRWHHKPSSINNVTNNNGSICYNYKSACFNDFTRGHRRINDPDHNCSFAIRAASYDWSKTEVQQWYLKNIIYPTLKLADGAWIDGNGPDNGAYMCSGICCGFDKHNSPQNQTEIDAFCDGERKVTTAAQKYLISHGGFDYKCFDFIQKNLPGAPGDNVTQCSDKLKKLAAMGVDNLNGTLNAVVLYGDRNLAKGYTDDTVAGAIATFLLVRGKYWFFHMPKKKVLNISTAKLLLSNYGEPKGLMREIQDRPGVFEREYYNASIILDCHNFSPQFKLNISSPKK